MKILILGCGTMASAIAQGTHKNGPQVHFTCFNPNKDKAEKLAKRINGLVVDKIPEMLNYDFVLIGCKPQHFQNLSKEIKGRITTNTIVLSMMAAVNLEQLQHHLQHEKIVRFMPNTPVSVGEGIHLVFGAKSLSCDEENKALHFLNLSSKCFDLKSEEQLDQLTPLSGCGVGVIFQLLDLLQKWTESFTTSEESKELVLQTFQGAISLARENKTKQFSELKNEVTSKGGVTEAILGSLTSQHLQEILFESLNTGLEKISTMRKNIPD